MSITILYSDPHRPHEIGMTMIVEQGKPRPRRSLITLSSRAFWSTRLPSAAGQNALSIYCYTRTHPHIDATYRVFPVKDGSFGIGIIVPGTSPVAVTCFSNVRESDGNYQYYFAGW